MKAEYSVEFSVGYSVEKLIGEWDMMMAEQLAERMVAQLVVYLAEM
jgi:hypothetical protein